MRPLPVSLAKLGAKFRWPDPNPDGTFTLPRDTAGAFSALLFGLVSYVTTQYARCSETKTTP